MSNDTIQNGSYLLTDLIQGDEGVADRDDFKDLSLEEVRQSLKLIIDNPILSEIHKQKILVNVWKIHYRQKPPTITEFLTQEWIGPTALSIYPHVKKTLEEFWYPFSPYRHLVLGSAIGWGKSLASTLSSLFVNTHLYLLRDAKHYYNIGQASSIVTALVSFSLDKAKQVLLQPFYQILLTAPKFRRVKKEESLIERQREYPDDIIWTTAGRVGSIQFAGDTHIMIASDPGHILGLTLMFGILSEISFFIEQGISADTIWRIYNDTKGRIFSRFGNQYFASTIIDSSPNDMELSPIDKYIFGGKAKEDPLNYVVTGSHWSVHPSKYPLWLKSRETFPVYRGSGSNPPKILNEDELSEYDSTEVYDVPIDVKQKFVDDLKKSVKDYCGWPSGSDDKLFDDLSVIDSIFDVNLRNVYSYIYAPASSPPERLIWDQIYKDFFIQLGPNQIEFYRAPREKRFIHIDQSESGDITGISMVHPEVNEKGEIVIIVDFTLAISPKHDKINLDAITKFIFDLRDRGKLDIGLITFDQYQSADTIQMLKRAEFFVEKFSVDRDKNPYFLLASYIKNGRLKLGRNIFLKNNLKSLQIIKGRTINGKTISKVDHKKGDIVYDDGANWDLSLMGVNAKDVSDSLCGAVFHALNVYKGVPRYQYILADAEIEVNKATSYKPATKDIKNKVKEMMHNHIQSRFGLTLTKD